MLDSFGIGALPDAKKFGDEGSNTFAHIALDCLNGKANAVGVREGPLYLPNLTRLGLNAALMACTGKGAVGFDANAPIESAYGYSREISFGKDTPSGHWELMGVPALFDWGIFPQTYPSFPQELLDALIREGNLPGILGNKASSGTTIIEELGDESVKTGKPIVYTSADSVIQIAAHEESFGLERLYNLCKIARKLADRYSIGRIIARPFIGISGHYRRTGNRHDYSVPPAKPTLLDKIKQSGREVVAIGKIGDIFAHQGTTQEISADGNMALFDATLKAMKETGNSSLIFTNFVDFDMLYGHRRDVIGYANALEKFDERLPELESLLRPGDAVIITGDHGCDPTFKGTDHTREHIPILIFGPGIKKGFIGERKTFADVAQTLAENFGLTPFEYGASFLMAII